jgi:hypothetical protein
VKLRARIADAYDKLPLDDPKAHAAYRELVTEVGRQYRHLLASGVKPEFVDYDPYPSAAEMVKDVRSGRIKVMKTAVTGSHPFMSDRENDMFRAVHDVYGHAATGRGFDRHGERAAFLSHAEMFRSPNSIRALASETEGQNASLIKNGGFGPQRVALLPDELIFTGGVPSLAASAATPNSVGLTPNDVGSTSNGVGLTPKKQLSSLIAACYSSACRPPTSGGTGGSSPVGRAQQLYLDSLGPRGSDTEVALKSPLYKKRSAADVMPFSEEEGRKLVTDNDATGRRILEKGVNVKDGKPIGVRANLNLKKTTGQTVQTIHDGTEAQLRAKTGFFGGEAIGYQVAVTVRNVNFSVNQRAVYLISSGQKNKFPMASVDGNFVSKPKPNRFDGVEVTFNPMKNNLFVDGAGRAVRSASEATVVGGKVFVRGDITYWGADAPAKFAP